VIIVMFQYQTTGVAVVIENNHLFEDCAYKVLGFSAPDLTNLGRAWHEPAAAGTIILLNACRLHSIAT
jgi:hypothetical protein